MEEISSGGLDEEKAVEANGFLKEFCSFDKILTYSKGLSDCLRGSQIDLAKQVINSFSTMATLEMLHTAGINGQKFAIQ